MPYSHNHDIMTYNFPHNQWHYGQIGVDGQTGRWFVFDSYGAPVYFGHSYHVVRTIHLQDWGLQGKQSIILDSSRNRGLRRASKQEVTQAIEAAFDILKTQKPAVTITTRGTGLKRIYEDYAARIQTQVPQTLAACVRELGATLRMQASTSTGYSTRGEKLFDAASWALAHLAHFADGRDIRSTFYAITAHKRLPVEAIEAIDGMDESPEVTAPEEAEAPVETRLYERFSVAVYDRKRRPYCVNDDDNLALSFDAYTVLEYLYARKNVPVFKSELLSQFFSDRAKPRISLGIALNDLEENIVAALGVKGEDGTNVIVHDDVQGKPAIVFQTYRA